MKSKNVKLENQHERNLFYRWTFKDKYRKLYLLIHYDKNSE